MTRVFWKMYRPVLVAVLVAGATNVAAFCIAAATGIDPGWALLGLITVYVLGELARDGTVQEAWAALDEGDEEYARLQAERDDADWAPYAEKTNQEDR